MSVFTLCLILKYFIYCKISSDFSLSLSFNVKCSPQFLFLIQIIQERLFNFQIVQVCFPQWFFFEGLKKILFLSVFTGIWSENVMCKIWISFRISLRLPKVLLVGKNMLYVWDYPGDIRGQCTVSIYRVKSTTINYIIQIFYKINHDWLNVL